MVSRGYHHGDLKNALLDAAAALVAEEGLDAVTMSKVAARSKVSSGAPYRHFKDRQALLRALTRRAALRLGERLSAVVSSAPNLAEGFRRSGVEYVRFAVEDPASFKLLSRIELIDGETLPSDPTGDRAFADGLSALLAQGSPDEPLDPNDPIIHQLAARCMVHGLAYYFVDGSLAALGAGSEQAGRLAEALTHALGAPGGPERFNLGDPNDEG